MWPRLGGSSGPPYGRSGSGCSAPWSPPRTCRRKERCLLFVVVHMSVLEDSCSASSDSLGVFLGKYCHIFNRIGVSKASEIIISCLCDQSSQLVRNPGPYNVQQVVLLGNYVNQALHPALVFRRVSAVMRQHPKVRA